MRAITVEPGHAHSARLEDWLEPPASEGAILVRTLALGVCGTDRDILDGHYGSAPPGDRRLVLGHESLGVVEEAPPGSSFVPGDRVVGVVRHPDPLPCPACAAGEWDMCRNGLYTERGIKARHGFGAERFRLEPKFAVKVDPALGLAAVLAEPASVVAKAWDHVEGIGRRSAAFAPRTLLVTGAGPIGLLAAMIGRQRGLDIHVLDRNREGPKPTLVRALGGTYHASPTSLGERVFDVVMECTAATPVIVEAIARCAPAGIVCLVGVSSPGGRTNFDIGGFNRTLVLNNAVIFGTVNANRRHYESALLALAKAERGWREALITRRVPLARWPQALVAGPGDIKVVIEFDG
ncbi:MAG: glucose 1-dehydrogenase [Pseudorhodoplanes sp.]|nr:glucose 1-dehydrogenase [Pseudorhodoplanes sp.]